MGRKQSAADFNYLCAAFAADNQHVGGMAGEQAVFHDAGDAVEFVFQFEWLVDGHIVHIDDFVAAVGGEIQAQLWAAAVFEQLARYQRAGGRDDFDRQWEFAQPGNVFALIYDTNEFFGGAGHDFFGQQRRRRRYTRAARRLR